MAIRFSVRIPALTALVCALVSNRRSPMRNAIVVLVAITSLLLAGATDTYAAGPIVAKNDSGSTVYVTRVTDVQNCDRETIRRNGASLLRNDRKSNLNAIETWKLSPGKSGTTLTRDGGEYSDSDLANFRYIVRFDLEDYPEYFTIRSLTRSANSSSFTLDIDNSTIRQAVVDTAFYGNQLAAAYGQVEEQGLGALLTMRQQLARQRFAEIITRTLRGVPAYRDQDGLIPVTVAVSLIPSRALATATKAMPKSEIQSTFTLFDTPEHVVRFDAVVKKNVVEPAIPLLERDVRNGLQLQRDLRNDQLNQLKQQEDSLSRLRRAITE